MSCTYLFNLLAGSLAQYCDCLLSVIHTTIHFFSWWV